MRYFTNLFSPETYEAFTRSDRTITGFRQTQRRQAQRLGPGDLFLCYVTRLSRWAGLIEVKSQMFEDETPVFLPENDPFSVRFQVKPLIWLSLERSVPIRDDELWNKLSFTREHCKSSSTWTGQLRASLSRMETGDAVEIRKALERQLADEDRTYPISSDERRRLRTPRVRVAPDRELPVSIPQREEEVPSQEPCGRASIQMQALLASIGERMGLKVWLPKSDRSRVFEHWTPDEESVLDTLPLNYDEATLNTVEQIDILWLRRRTIIRAFEVEHTTSIYSGILRMADLLALQPNLEIKAHIVAPSERRER